MSNVTLSDRAKRCIVWIVGVCVVLGATVVCIHSCKRNIQCTVNAKRNSVTVTYIPKSDSVKPIKTR